MSQKLLSFVLLAVVLLVCGNIREVNASVGKDIKVSGFAYPRNRFALTNPLGKAPPQSYETKNMYDYLKDFSFFGPGGVVDCKINFQIPVGQVEAGSLVNEHGDLLTDVFFSGPTVTPLTTEEAKELARFVRNGGILYISGEVLHPTMGPSYDPLFVDLGIGDRITSTRIYEGGGSKESSVPINRTIVTDGPFGNVDKLTYFSYKVIRNDSSILIVTGQDNVNSLVIEKSINSGYLIATGESIYRRNNVIPYILDDDNRNYFLNMFALACRDDEHILDVPSFKQGLPPYDSFDPVWEHDIYDAGDKQRLWCGVNMAECGCATSTASMVLSYYGVKLSSTGDFVNPGTLNDFFSSGDIMSKNRYISWGYSYGDFRWSRVDDFSSLASIVNHDQPRLGLPIREDYNPDRLRDYIDQEIPVILKVRNTGGGIHWVVVKGYQGNDFVINDPATFDSSIGEHSTLLSLGYSPYLERSMIIYKTTNSDYSSIQLIFPKEVSLLIMGADGKRTGIDPKTGAVYEEIPGSMYIFEESIDDPTESNPMPPESEGVHVITIQKPTAGKYNVLATTSGDGSSYGLYVTGKEAGQAHYLIDIDINYDQSFEYNPETEDKLIVVSVNIDIRPFMSRNYINSKSRRSVMVAILSDADFNAVKEVNKKSLTLGKKGNEDSLRRCLRWGWDVNRDGYRDLICLFKPKKMGFLKGDTEGFLMGNTKTGMPIKGKDEVRVYR